MIKKIEMFQNPTVYKHESVGGKRHVKEKKHLQLPSSGEQEQHEGKKN